MYILSYHFILKSFRFPPRLRNFI